MADLDVDVDALTELARQPDSVKAPPARAEANMDAYDARPGSGRVDGALDDVVSGWRDGRGQLISRVDGLAEPVAGAVETYRDREAALSAAAGAGSS